MINQDELRKLFYHEQVHASGHASKEHRTYITEYNKHFPVTVKEGVGDYYLDPGEIRARSMSLRRLHQTTGKSYEELLNNWNTIPHRPDPNVDDLINYYDRESLLNYLNNFLKDGGRINYLDFFK